MTTRHVDPLTHHALSVYTVALIGETLQAQAIWGVPLTWLAQVMTIGFVAILLLNTYYVRVPRLAALSLLLGWGAVITVAHAVSGDFQQMMPLHATTPYPMYIVLRFVALTGFAAQIYLVYWLLARGRISDVVRRTTAVATVTAVIAIYIYFAQVNGWPMPPRTRLRADGVEYVPVYTYAFHRAVGMFLEPGDLAAWLVLPLFLSFFGGGRMLKASSVLVTAAVLLSGSLAAIAGLVLGGVVAIAVVWPFRNISPTRVAQACLAIGAAVAVFSLVAVENEDGSTDLLAVLGERVGPIVDDGMQASNRDYIYYFVADTSVDVFGVGFGNSNLLLTTYHRSEVIVSFLSAYFVTLYSTGYVGLALLAFFLVAPLRSVLNCRLSRSMSQPGDLLALTAAYAAYVVMIGFRSEELPMNLGIAYALLTFVSQRNQAALPGGSA